MSEVIDTLNLLEAQIRVSEADEQIIRADERARVRVETIDKLEQKLRIWDNKANAIPSYVWHCFNEMREQKNKNSNDGIKSPCCYCKVDKASCCGCPEYFDWKAKQMKKQKNDSSRTN